MWLLFNSYTLYLKIANNPLAFSSPLCKSVANIVSIDLCTYSPTTANDTKYLRLDGTNSISTNVGITVSRTGEFSGALDYIKIANVVSIDLGAYSKSTTTANDTEYLKLDGTKSQQ